MVDSSPNELPIAGTSIRGLGSPLGTVHKLKFIVSRKTSLACFVANMLYVHIAVQNCVLWCSHKNAHIYTRVYMVTLCLLSQLPGYVYFICSDDEAVLLLFASCYPFAASLQYVTVCESSHVFSWDMSLILLPVI